MLKSKKLNSIVLTAVMMLSISCSGVLAKGTDTSKKGEVLIPTYMQPGTVIIYDDNLDYTIISGGEPTGPAPEPYVAPEPLPAPSDWSQEEIDQYNYENKRIELAKEAIRNGDPSVVHELPPVAKPGLKVTYGGDGIRMHIYYPDSKGGYTLRNPDLVPNAFATNSVYQIAVWGTAYTCILTYDDIDDSVVGTGRFTCFDDVTGDHDNPLQLGDCATKEAYDNIASNTVVHARNLDTDQVHTYTKNDRGAMQDAVLDIWKEGIDWIGGNYSTLTNVNNGRMYHKTRFYW